MKDELFLKKITDDIRVPASILGELRYNGEQDKFTDFANAYWEQLNGVLDTGPLQLMSFCSKYESFYSEWTKKALKSLKGEDWSEVLKYARKMENYL